MNSSRMQGTGKDTYRSVLQLEQALLWTLLLRMVIAFVALLWSVVYSRIKWRLGEARSLTHNERAEEVYGHKYKKKLERFYMMRWKRRGQKPWRFISDGVAMKSGKRIGKQKNP